MAKSLSWTAARTAVARYLGVSPLHDLVALAQTALVFSDQLGDDHPRIAHALMRRAEIDARLTNAEQRVRLSGFPNDDDPDAAQAELDWAEHDRDALEAAFVERSLAPFLPDLDDLAPLQSRPVRAYNRGRRPLPYRSVSDGHLAVTLAAFPPAPEPGTLWYDALVRYATQTFGPLAPKAGEERTDIDGLPDTWQSGLLDRLGQATVALTDPDAAEPLWKPVLDLGAAPRGWTESLSREVTRLAVVPDPIPETLESWRRMIRYALGHPAWSPGARGTASTHDSGSSWRPLLGFTDVVGVYGWTDDQRAAFDAVQAEILEWAGTHLNDSSSVSRFASLLTKPAFASLCVPGLVKLASAAEAHPTSFWGRPRQNERSTANVSALLDHMWESRLGDLRSAEPKAAFEHLLQALVTRQDEGALLLADEVRREGL